MSRRKFDLVKDIEKKLNVKCNSASPFGMDKFIKEHYDRLQKYNKENGISSKNFSPTNQQLKFISSIEGVLDVKFNGKTVGDAENFINENLKEYNNVLRSTRKIKD